MDDTDNDGHSNLEEYFAGTDPRDPGSIFTIQDEVSVGEDFVLTFTGMNGRTYAVEYNDLFPSGEWTHPATVQGDNETTSVTNITSAEILRRFYRIRVSR